MLEKPAKQVCTTSKRTVRLWHSHRLTKQQQYFNVEMCLKMIQPSGKLESDQQQLYCSARKTNTSHSAYTHKTSTQLRPNESGVSYKDVSVLLLDEQMAAARGPSVRLIMFFRAQFVALFTPNVTKMPQRHFSFSSPPSLPPPDIQRVGQPPQRPVQMITSKCPELPLQSGLLASSELRSGIRT